MEPNSWIWKACYLIALALFITACYQAQQRHSIIFIIVFAAVFIATFTFINSVKNHKSWPSQFLHAISFLPNFLVPIFFFRSNSAVVSRERSNSNIVRRSKLFGLPPVVVEEISLIIKLLLKDFVRLWYENITDNEEFMKSMTILLEESVLLLTERLKRIEKFDATKKIVDAYHCYVILFSKCLVSVRAKLGKCDAYSEHDKINSEFSTLIDVDKYDDEYWTNVTSTLMQMICPEGNLKSFELFNNTGFITILHNQLVLPVLDHLTDSDWLYESLIILLSKKSSASSKLSSNCSVPSQNNSAELSDVNSSDHIARALKNKSSSLPSLSLLENLYDERFFKQYLPMESNPAQAESQSSLPDLNKLAEYCDDLNLESSQSSHESAQEAAVLFSICSQENLHKFHDNADNIKLVFTDVNIPVTEQHQSQGISQPYTVYCIQYLGWYMIPCSTETDDEDGGYFVIEGMKYVQKQTVVRRRYREFVNLQTRLENNPVLKHHLKGIKGPNKYLNSPFTNMAKHTVEQRRTFLEQYLVILCRTSQICTSPELREFMAYGSNANIAFVNKPKELLIPRIDRLVIKSMSGMFSKIRTALPIRDSNKVDRHDYKKAASLPYLNSDLPRIDSLGFSVIHSYHDELPSNQVDEPSVELRISTFLQSIDINKNIPARGQLKGEFRIDQPRSVASASPHVVTTNSTSNVVRLSDAVIDLAIESFVEQHVPDNLVSIVNNVFGDCFNRYLTENIEELTNVDSVSSYICYLRQAFWPSGIFNNKPAPIKSQTEKYFTKARACLALKQFFPDVLPTLIGQQQYDNCAKFFIESVQHRQLNRVLIGMLCDVLLDILTTNENEHVT